MPVITNSLSGTSAKLLDNTNVTLRFDSSSFTNQVVTLADKTYTNKITITRPFELIASNIKKGVEIAGITGTYEVVLNTETAETPLSMKDGNQVVLPSKPNYTLSEVTIVKPNTFTPENIKAGVEIGGITGTYTGSGGTTLLKTVLDATKSTKYLFSGYSGNSLSGLIDYNDTSNVVDASYMFYQCTGLADMPILNFKKLQTSSYMFASSNLKEFSSELANEFSPLVNIDYMFYNCKELTSIALFDTSNVKKFYYTFMNCTALTSIPLFDTSNVNDMSYAFMSCIALTSIPLLNTSKVTNMSYTF